MRIALIVDNPFRDLPGIVLLAAKLCEQGATCYLVPVNLEWREVGALAPDFVLLTNLRRPRQEFAGRLLDAGVRVGVLESEGGVMPDLAHYAKMTAPDPDVFSRISCFCTWGPRVADYAVGQRWYSARQVTVTGAPRFDFYASQWRAAALRASSELAAVRQPIILINGSFPRGNPRFHTLEQEIQSWAGLGFDRDYMVRFQAIERQAMHDLAEVANHTANRFPDATVVYRPHPFERLDTYDALLEKRENLRLLKVGTVEGWILRAAVVIHRNSTTAIEAAMAGVPALLPTWLPVAERLEACDAVSVKCGTLEVLDEAVAAALAGLRPAHAPLDEDITRVILDWFHTIDGAAHARVADAIVPHVAGGSAPLVNERACRRIHYGWRPHALTARSRAGITGRMAFGVPVTWSFARWSHRDPGEAWANTDKFYDTSRVKTLAEAMGTSQSRMSIRPADSRVDYRVPYAVGRTVVMEPARP